VASAAIASICLSGCGGGLVVPEMQAFYEDKPQERVHENTIVNQIKCELHKRFEDAIEGFKRSADSKGVDWLNDWGAKVTMRLSVDEKSALDPGVTFFKYFKIQL
jgi:hypothetical protein